MKFHLPSFALGFVSAAAMFGARDALKPVAVELGSLTLHLAKVARAVVERQREKIEDLWAEIEHGARERARGSEPRAANGTVAHSTEAIH
jgi:hypothetical protein